MRGLFENTRKMRSPGVAVFSSQAMDLWDVIWLARPVPDLLVVDYSAHIRPLARILDQYRRVCTLLVDRNRARIFEIFMGEIEEQSAIFSEVPPKVREAGWYGLSEKRIERHIDFHLDNHLKKVGDLALRHFQEKRFDWLLLGAQPEVSGEMERALHSFLRQRLRKTFRVDMNASPREVLNKTLEFEQEIKSDEDRALVSRLMNSLKPRGFGISGIHETLSCLHEGNVHTLLLEEGYVQEGARCSRCGFMGLTPGICPICGEKMMAVPDIVDEAAENAINQGCEVFHMAPGSGLEGIGRIGAVLRHGGERPAS